MRLVTFQLTRTALLGDVRSGVPSELSDTRRMVSFWGAVRLGSWEVAVTEISAETRPGTGIDKAQECILINHRDEPERAFCERAAFLSVRQTSDSRPGLLQLTIESRLPVSDTSHTPNLPFRINNLQKPIAEFADPRVIQIPGDIPMTPSASTQPNCVNIRNRANTQHSTGPRSESGKQRSALNALTHGLTARTAVLPSEDPAAFEQHRRQFLAEYNPKTPTETQLVNELADSAWRLNRVPLLEAEVPSSAAPNPESLAPAVAALATLGLSRRRLRLPIPQT